MTIPVGDTKIDVHRTRTEDAYDEPAPFLIASGVRAVIDAPIAAARMPSTERPGGTLHKMTRTLTCDPVDLQVNDIVTDTSNGLEYRVVLTGPGPNIIPYTTAEIADIGYKPR